MAPNRTERAQRHREVPDTFILDWRSSTAGPQGATPARRLVRRPPTACEACRSAKVKCNGRQDCERCVARGLACNYISRDSQLQPVLMKSPHRKDDDGPSTDKEGLRNTPTSQISIPSMPEEFNGALNAQPLMRRMICQPGTTLTDCANGTGNLAEGFNWDGIDLSGHTFDASLSNFPSTQPLTGGSLQNLSENVTELPPLDNIDLFSGIQRELSYAAVNDNSPPAACSHRLDLLPFPAQIAAAIQQERPDLVLKVTREVISSCQETLDCRKCQVTCTDLLLMMTVLQETHPCFDCVATKDLDGDIELSFGGYQVSFNDASLRRMVVMDLVQRASTVLTAIGAKSHCMMDNLPEPCRQARANIVYLDETISHFGTILERVKTYVQRGSSGL